MRGKVYILAVAMCFAMAVAASGQEGRKAISKTMPRYPDIAKRMNLVGTVKVEALIGPDGKVKNVNVVGGHPILVSATVDAVKEWRYEPSKSETVATLSFDFKP
jgi:protein TonB